MRRPADQTQIRDYVRMIEQERLRRLLSQRQLARLAGVSDHTVSAVLSGARSPVGAIRKLLEALGLKPHLQKLPKVAP